MVEYYVAKIINKEIYTKTGEVWCIEDVPKLWRKKVAAALKE